MKKVVIFDFLYRSTLDIDKNDKDFINDIEIKIKRCIFLEEFEKRDSSSKGVHIIIKCSIKCDICRFVYDDFRRFAYDQQRKPEEQNILFNEKVYIKK